MYSLSFGECKQKSSTQNGRMGYQTGKSVAICGDHYIVGSPGANNNTGKVDIYDLDGSSRCINGDIENGNFGVSVDLTEDYAIIGSHGAAFIYTHRHGECKLVCELIVPKPSIRFGESVGISGNLVIVGDSLATGGGAAYIFSLISDECSLDKSLVSGESHPVSFGQSVAISGNLAVSGRVQLMMIRWE